MNPSELVASQDAAKISEKHPSFALAATLPLKSHGEGISRSSAGGAPNFSWQYADDPAALRRLNDPNRRALGPQGKPCPVKKPMKAEEYFRGEILTALPSGSSLVSVEPFPN